jgi:hypothetical protein
MYREAVRGKLMLQNNKSDMQRLITKAVVAWWRSLEHQSSAIAVMRFPETKQGIQVSKVVIPFGF